jgi:PAS domain S-box-containing protein
VYGIIEQVRDITDTKKIEDRLRLISEVTTDLNYEWDVRNGTLEWFGDIDAILGYQKGEITKSIHGWINLIHPEDQEILKDSVERHKTETEPIQEIYRVRKKDGTWVYWQDRCKPILDGDGKPVKWIGGCKDITNEKNIERQVSDEKIFIDSILKSLPGVFYLFDENGQFIRWNKNFEEVTEYSSDELKNMTPIDLFDNDEKDKIASAIQKAFEKGYANVEGKFFTKTGKKKPYFFTGVATIYREKSLLVGVGIDLSNIRKTQIELNKRLEELETVEQLAVNRELKMIELKREVNELLMKQGMKEKYDINES